MLGALLGLEGSNCWDLTARVHGCSPMFSAPAIMDFAHSGASIRVIPTILPGLYMEHQSGFWRVVSLAIGLSGIVAVSKDEQVGARVDSDSLALMAPPILLLA